VVVLAVLPVLAAAVFLLPKARLQFLSEPEPEKPNLHILGIAPLKASPERDSEILRDARRIIAAYPEVAFIYSTARLLEDDGTKTPRRKAIISSSSSGLRETGRLRSWRTAKRDAGPRPSSSKR